MEMQNVLDKLREIENPSEDQQAAIKSAEFADTGIKTTATGEQTYVPYGQQLNEIAKLAGLDTIAVVTEPTVESAEKEGKPITEAQSPAQKAAFQKMLDANKSKTKDKDEDEDKEEVEESIEVHEDDAQEEVVSEATNKGPVEVASWIETNGGQTEAILLRKGDEYALATDLANMDPEAWWEGDIEDHWKEYTDTAKRMPGHGVYHWKSKDEFKKWATDNTSTYAKNIKFGVNFREPMEEVVAEGPTRKDFQMVADLIKGQSDPAKKKELAQHHADVFATQNPRFDRDKFMMASGVMESQDLEEAYDPSHVADIIKKHEETGHQVELDSYKDDQAGFTVTFLDGKRRHYLYTQTGSKVTSLEPTDPLIDPNAPKRERGRPKKEGLGEEGKTVEEGDNIYHPCTKSFTHERFGEGTVIHGEHTLAEDGTVTHYDAEFVKEDGTRYVVKNIPVANMKGAVQVEHSHPAKKRKNEGIEEEVDELTRTFEAKLAEALPEEAEVITESIQVNQNINDDGQESVSINAQGNQEHLDMLKSLLALAGQSRGYDEYQGKEEVVEPEQEAPVEENLANSPDPKYADVDTQLNKQAGGLNKPKKAYAKAQDGDNAMAVEESMFDLYKEYKGG
jgi:hypothetical protein